MELDAARPAAARPLALDAPTLVHAFQYTAALRPDAVALRVPGDAVALTWREYAQRVERIAAGLAALGVERGDAVGLMLRNRPEFHLVDTAVLHLGATPFSVYNTSTPGQVAHQFANAGNRVVVTERQFLPVVRAAGATAVVLVDGSEDGAIGLEQLEERGASSFRFTETWRAVRPSDLATIIYTHRRRRLRLDRRPPALRRRARRPRPRRRGRLRGRARDRRRVGRRAVGRARAAAGDRSRGRGRQRTALARRAGEALRGPARGVARGGRAADPRP